MPLLWGAYVLKRELKEKAYGNLSTMTLGGEKNWDTAIFVVL
jgi:hypothetical protein